MKRFLIFLSIIILVLVIVLPFDTQKPIRYIDRKNGIKKTEKVMGEYALRWLYNNPLGLVSLHSLAKRKFFSDWYGKRMDNSASIQKIKPFIQDFNIDMRFVEKDSFASFNDFFTRRLKPSALQFCKDSFCLASPSDGKILAYKNISNSNFIIKGNRFNINSFLRDTFLSQHYQDASLIIIRLAPSDYHRFYFPLKGTVTKEKQIDGFLYSVSPIALRQRIQLFCENKRSYTIIRNTIIGDFIMVEVGATMVGSIVQTYNQTKVQKGTEKGYFKFGGSTIVLIFKKNQIKIDDDLLQNTRLNLETSVNVGERIAYLLH